MIHRRIQNGDRGDERQNDVMMMQDDGHDSAFKECCNIIPIYIVVDTPTHFSVKTDCKEILQDNPHIWQNSRYPSFTGKGDVCTMLRSMYYDMIIR